MKKMRVVLMSKFFLGSTGLVLAQSPSPASNRTTAAAPVATPAAKAKKHKEKKKGYPL